MISSISNADFLLLMEVINSYTCLLQIMVAAMKFFLGKDNEDDEEDSDDEVVIFCFV